MHGPINKRCDFFRDGKLKSLYVLLPCPSTVQYSISYLMFEPQITGVHQYTRPGADLLCLGVVVRPRP
jgi:hypothetical protein